MQARRSNLLLILLVLTPVALLTWLGTYLIRDATRSTDSAQQAVLTERLLVVNHQLLHDLRQFTDHLDSISAAPGSTASQMAGMLGQHPWVGETWTADASGQVVIVADKKAASPVADAMAGPRSVALQELLKSSGITGPFKTIEHQPFAQLGSPLDTTQRRFKKAVWQTAVKSENYHLDTAAATEPGQKFPSGWHVTDGDLIYWRLISDQLVCARIDVRLLGEALFQRLPIQGMDAYPGRLTLTTLTGIPLHVWGEKMPGSENAPVAWKQCSAPLSQWELAYTPATVEFPKPYLFPILLGVGSGCILVLALAWTFFRENARELRLAQQRVSFVNQISHELKTPLTNIRLYTEMAASRVEESGDAIAKRHLGVVETETARLDRLIQNVLNYARQQRDKLTVQPRPIFLDQVVKRAIEHWRLLLERKGFTIESSLCGPGEMNADPDAIEQILGNLLSNVDKYAGYGKWVSIRTETTQNGARLTVEDRGPGIATSKRYLVFEPFERLRSDLDEGVSGTGIGLTISRELAELHGGTLEVCPNFRDGARFILTLPLTPPTTKP